MNVQLVDERDVSIELPLPIFRIAVWENSFSVAVYDMTDGTLDDALAFVEARRAAAFNIELHAKFYLHATQQWATILLKETNATQ